MCPVSRPGKCWASAGHRPRAWVASQPSEDSLRHKSDKSGLLLLWRPIPWKTRALCVKSAAGRSPLPFATSSFTPKKAFRTSPSGAGNAANLAKARVAVRPAKDRRVPATRPCAPNAAPRPRCRSALAETGRCTAGPASRHISRRWSSLHNVSLPTPPSRATSRGFFCRYDEHAGRNE